MRLTDPMWSTTYFERASAPTTRTRAVSHACSVGRTSRTTDRCRAGWTTLESSVAAEMDLEPAQASARNDLSAPVPAAMSAQHTDTSRIAERTRATRGRVGVNRRALRGTGRGYGCRPVASCRVASSGASERRCSSHPHCAAALVAPLSSLFAGGARSVGARTTAWDRVCSPRWTGRAPCPVGGVDGVARCGILPGPCRSTDGSRGSSPPARTGGSGCVPTSSPASCSRRSSSRRAWPTRSSPGCPRSPGSTPPSPASSRTRCSVRHACWCSGPTPRSPR